MSSLTATGDQSDPFADSDIPTLAYRQPAELVYNRLPIDRKVMGIWIFGYKADPTPEHKGVREIGTLVKLLEEAGIASCMAAETALVYYGTTRIRKEWTLCVPTKLYEKAIDLVRANDKFEPFFVVDLDYSTRLRFAYPRFRFIGLNLFFRIIPCKVYLLDICPDNIEWSQGGLPFPKLVHLAQGLLDTREDVDLEDLVDGMKLSKEWGEEHLDLEGVVSVEHAVWRANLLAGGKASPDEIPGYVARGLTRKSDWYDLTNPEKVRLRMEPKYPQATYDTRFRRKGSRDPRSYKRDWI